MGHDQFCPAVSNDGPCDCGYTEIERRLLHPTTADIYQYLDDDHCEQCESWATGIQAWHTDPNTVAGREQLDAIGAHILATYPDMEG